MIWLKRVRASLVVGLTWAVLWAVIGGGIMEGIVDPDGKIMDMWPQPLAFFGFFFGIVFSIALTLTERSRRFEDLSFKRFAGLGAAVGVALTTVALSLGMIPGVPLWLRIVAIGGSVTALSAVSATAALGIARFASRRERERLPS